MSTKISESFDIDSEGEDSDDYCEAVLEDFREDVDKIKAERNELNKVQSPKLRSDDPSFHNDAKFTSNFASSNLSKKVFPFNLKIWIHKGYGLPIADISTSDPYVVVYGGPGD